MTDDRSTVQDLGEQELLKRLQAFCPADVVGDDAAVMSLPAGRSLVVTTDVLVDGVHFSDRTTSPVDAGWRAAAANLSDLAAMNAQPIGLTVGLGLRGDVAVSWVERLYQGLTECLRAYGTAIVGGDVVQSPVLSVSITALGEVEPQRVMRRSAARVGDAIVVTGPHGGSRAGLELLLHPDRDPGLSERDRALLIRTHQRPRPRLDVLPHLPDLRIAGMDSSDGLADAILQICRASGVGAQVDRAAIPMLPALQQFDRALEWALYGGEDFELVLCLPLAAAERLVQQVAGAAIVGRTTAAPDVWLVANDTAVRLTLEAGFQHF